MVAERFKTDSVSQFFPKQPASMKTPAILPEASFWRRPPTALQDGAMEDGWLLNCLSRAEERPEDEKQVFSTVVLYRHYFYTLLHVGFCVLLNPDKFSTNRQTCYILIDLVLKLEHCWTLLEVRRAVVCFQGRFSFSKRLSFRGRATRCHKWGRVLLCSLWFLLQRQMKMDSKSFF